VPLGEATLNHFFKRLDFGVQDFSLRIPRHRGHRSALMADSIPP
jgi:hypothetical protein